MNHDVIGNINLLKEVGKVNAGKVENCSRIKDGNGKLAVAEEVVRKIWKD